MEIKKFVSIRYEAQKSIERMELKKDIRIVLTALMDIKSQSEMIVHDSDLLDPIEKLALTELIRESMIQSRREGSKSLYRSELWIFMLQKLNR